MTASMQNSTHVDQLKYQDLSYEKMGLIKEPFGRYRPNINDDCNFRGEEYKTTKKIQYLWRGIKEVSDENVQTLLNHLVQYNQSVHINTGTHGDGSGLNINDTKDKKYADNNILRFDLRIASKVDNVSTQIVSSCSPAIYPKEANHIIDAWCWSANKPFDVPHVAFGRVEWAKHFGNVFTDTPLPSDINDILKSDCPFWKKKRIKDTHLLILIPENVDGTPFNLDKLMSFEKKKNYDSLLEAELGEKTTQSHWILITKDIIPNTKGKNFNCQIDIVKNIDKNYRLPEALELATAIVVWKKMFPQSKTFAEPSFCEEKVGDYPGYHPAIYRGGPHKQLEAYLTEEDICWTNGNVGIRCVRSLT